MTPGRGRGFEPSEDDPTDLDDELRAHLSLSADFHRARGLDSMQAEALALVRFGDPARVRREVRRVYAPLWARLVVSVGRATIVTASVALLAGSLALLTALHHRAPRSVADGEPWVSVLTHSDGQADGATLSDFSTFAALRERTDLFDAVAASRYQTHVIAGDFPAEPLRVKYVSADAPSQLGWSVSTGHTIAADDDGASVALLTDASWARWFDRAPDAVGKEIVIGGHVHRVVGILSPSVDFFYPSAVVVPLDSKAERLARDPRLLVTARLAPGVTLQRHPTSLLSMGDGASYMTIDADLVPLSETFSRPFAARAWWLMALVFVLALSSLGWAWPTASARVRADSTAKLRMVWVLACCGAAIALTPWAASLLSTYVAGASASAFSLFVDGRVLALTAIVVALILSLIELTSRARPSAIARARLGLTLQLGITATVLTLATPWLRDAIVEHRASVDPQLTVTALYDRSGSRDWADSGVTEADGWAFTSALPALGEPARSLTTVESDSVTVGLVSVSPNYFDQVGIGWIAGSTWGPQRASREVVIDRELADRLFGSEVAVGRSIRVAGVGSQVTVRGVVEEVGYGSGGPVVYRMAEPFERAGMLAVHPNPDPVDSWRSAPVLGPFTLDEWWARSARSDEDSWLLWLVLAVASLAILAEATAAWATAERWRRAHLHSPT